jgi:hypothetical protein
MPQNSVDPWNDLAAAVTDDRDPKQISELIEQLDRDFAETQRNAAQRQ